MQMKVGDGLADLVIDDHERTIRVPRRFDRSNQSASGPEQRLGQTFRKVKESLMMLLGYEKGVTWEQRPYVQEPEHQLFVQNDVGGNLTRDDLTEDAHRARD